MFFWNFQEDDANHAFGQILDILLLHKFVDGGFLVDDDFGFDIQDIYLDFGQLAHADSRSPLRNLAVLQRFLGHIGGQLVLGFLDAVGQRLKHEKSIGCDDYFFAGEAGVGDLLLLAVFDWVRGRVL